MRFLVFIFTANFFLLLSMLVRSSPGAAGSTADLTGDSPVLVTDMQGSYGDDDYNDDKRKSRSI